VSQDSNHFNGEVKKFMQRKNKRPHLKCVFLTKNTAGLELEISLFPSKIAFYDLANLERFKKSMEDDEPTLEVSLTGAEDPIIEQLAEFLSTSINFVHIYDYGSSFSSSDLSLFAELLASSTIKDLTW
ncbi:hypothetical protein PMAYCL1PPCAC_26987, partial [Pristionchus mayeri]